MDLDSALQTFIVESRELLEEMEGALLRSEQEPLDEESLNAVFRAAHTIKGTSGLFGLDHIVAFTHVVESVLDRVRSHTLEIDSNLTSLLLESCDFINELISAVADDRQPPGAGDLRVRLERYLGDTPSVTPASVPVQVAPPVFNMGGGQAETDHWHISLRFGPDVLRNGMDPLSFIRYLTRLGQIVSIRTLAESLPDVESMDPETCYLGFEIAFQSRATKAEIAGVFEFVMDDARIHIVPPHSRIEEYIQLILEATEETAVLGQMLVNCGTLTEQELARALAAQHGNDPKRLIGEVLIQEGLVPPQVVEAALQKQQQIKETKTQQAKMLKVDADKLDMLINLVGELVIAGAGASMVARKHGLAEMLEVTSTVTRLIEEVRDSALNLRMVQVGDTFNRFQRVVRDVSKDLGKDVALTISGGETELDKTVIEKIGDPLMHLVRNSMDHGIERAEIRTARGKPAQGQLRLHAYHESGSIVIEVSDDGGGLNSERILAKAIERGVVAAGQTLTEKEIANLIFEPGFSTAEAVTNLSGRGVGMDVVRKNIEALRGTIEIDSTEGKGTTTRIRLPLTLAIIDGFLVGVGKASFVIPLNTVVECVEMSEEDRDAMNERHYVNLRGEVLPYLRLREIYDIEGLPARRENIVVVQYAGMRAGLVVDALQGEFQTVIKPLGRVFRNLRGIGGSTILGTGEVALILDVPTMIQQATSGGADMSANERANRV